MKIYRFLLIATLCVSALLAVMTGCKYNAAEPLWDSPASTTTAATITSIDPAQASAGVNYITIHGTNFTGALDSTKIQSSFIDTTHSRDTTILYSGVYFDKVLAEIVECSSTMIKVRRPNIASSSCVIKVAPSKALLAAKTNYSIDTVVVPYGGFIDNVQFATVAMDKAGNLYTVASLTRVITKVAPTSQKTVFTGLATKAPTDARVNPAGDKMYLLSTARKIDVVDLQTGSVALLALPTSGNQLPSGKLPSFGDFDTSGYFYCGGLRTGIIVIPPNLVIPTATLYTTDNILGMRVYNGYLYVLVKPATGTPALVINRHLIGANGTLGAQEQWLVLDQTISGTSTTTIKSLAFAANGTLYLCTNLTNPIFIVDPVTKNVDYLYKGIIPAYGSQFCSFLKQVSSSLVTYLYVITGDGSTQQQYNVYQVNVGS